MLMATIADGKFCATVITDAGRLYDAVAAVRNVHVSPSDRRPLNFDVCEHRSASRVPLCVPLTVGAAVIQDGALNLSEATIEAEAVDLAVRGLSFSHAEPLPNNMCTATFELPADSSVTFLLNVLWTTSEARGTLRSGGRFLGIVEA